MKEQANHTAQCAGSRAWASGLQEEVLPEAVPEAVPEVLPKVLAAARLYVGWALLALAAALYTLVMLNLGAQDALAAPKGGGGGDAIVGTINNVRDYVAAALLSLGGLGFVGSLGLKAASPVNENAQYLSHMGIKSSFIAVLGGAIVGPVMTIIQGLAA